MHNGAGSTTKDIGVIGMGRGWEIYVGGSSGRIARSGELLTVAPTDEEAAEMIRGWFNIIENQPIIWSVPGSGLNVWA